MCTACGERVVGEGSGCTAMDQVYHISCFTCQHCAIQLQGKPFYALEGKPYCEEDYLVSPLSSLLLCKFLLVSDLAAEAVAMVIRSFQVVTIFSAQYTYMTIYSFLVLD